MFVNGLPKLCVSPSRSAPDEMPLPGALAFQVVCNPLGPPGQTGCNKGGLRSWGRRALENSWEGRDHHSGVQSDDT